MSEPPEVDRRHAIAAAAAAVIGRDGLPALSHRAVAREAGVPLSAVPYYYGTKDALLAAAIDHINQSEIALFTRVARELIALGDLDLAATAKAIANVIRTLTTSDRESRIGHVEAIMYALRQDPPLDAAASWWQTNIDAARAILTAVGQEDPETDARLMFAAGFGLYFAQLTAPSATDAVLERDLQRLFIALDTRGHSSQS